MINLDCIHGANSGNQNHMSISDNQIQHWLIWYLKSNHYSHRLTAKTHKVEAIFKPHKKNQSSIFRYQATNQSNPYEHVRQSNPTHWLIWNLKSNHCSHWLTAKTHKNSILKYQPAIIGILKPILLQYNKNQDHIIDLIHKNTNFKTVWSIYSNKTTQTHIKDTFLHFLLTSHCFSLQQKNPNLLTYNPTMDEKKDKKKG